ncbi:MAG: glucose-6-phosphate dehydrogenase assembly protein OpcA, partial [Pseudonocardiaceae bacterium]
MTGAAAATPDPATTTTTTTTLGTWSGTNVTSGQVEQALSSLRRHEQRAAVRASVLTLVIVVADQTEADAALTIVGEMGTSHPSRTIVLVVGKHQVRGPKGGRFSRRVATAIDPNPNGRDAVVKVQAFERAGTMVTFEDIVLTIRGQGRHHLDSIIEPFTLPDVRMVTWLPSRLPSVGDPLMAAANMVVVDSRAAAGGQGTVSDTGIATAGAVLASSAALARRIPVADLSWIRLAPWRRLLAGLFEGAVTRPFVAGVRQVVVTGNPGPRLLLGGWLLERLNLSPAQVVLEPAEHVTMAVEAWAGG